MATPQETFERTMDTYKALTLYRAFKEYQDLVESGVGPATASM